MSLPPPNIAEHARIPWKDFDDLAADDDIDTAFTLFLGRHANASAIAEKRGFTIFRLVERLLTSLEFEEQVLAYLERGQEPPRTVRITPELPRIRVFAHRLRAPERIQSTWLELIRLVTVDADSPLASRLRASRNKKLRRILDRITASYEAHPRAPALAPTVAKLTPEDASALTFLFIGRRPNARDDLAARAAMGMMPLVKRLIASAECDRSVLDPALRGARLPHEGHEPSEALLARLASVLPLSTPTAARIRQAQTWSAVLGSVLTDSIFEANVLQPILPKTALGLASLKALRAGEALLASANATPLIAAVLDDKLQLNVTLRHGTHARQITICDAADLFRSVTVPLPLDPTSPPNNGEPHGPCSSTVPLPAEFLDGSIENAVAFVGGDEFHRSLRDAFPISLRPTEVFDGWVASALKRLAHGDLQAATQELSGFQFTPGAHKGRLLFAELLAAQGQWDAASGVMQSSSAASWGELTDDALALISRLHARAGRIEEALAAWSTRTTDSSLAGERELATYTTWMEWRAAGCKTSATPWAIALEESLSAGAVSLPDLRSLPADARDEAISHLVSAQLALWVPPSLIAATLRAASRWGVHAGPLHQRADERGLGYAYDPVFAILGPDSVTSPPALKRIARVAEFQDQLVVAAAFVGAALLRKPDDHDALVRAAFIASRCGDKPRAAKLFSQAVERRPTDLKLQLHLTKVERDLCTQDPLRSTETLERLLRRLQEAAIAQSQRDYNDHEARLQLATILALREQFEEAHAILADLLQVEAYGTSMTAVKEMVRACERTARHAEGQEWAELGLRLFNKSTFAIAAAKALRAQDRANEAQEVLQSRSWQTDVEVGSEAVRNLFFTGRFDEAARTAEQLIKAHPDHHSLRLYCATAYLELGAAERAAWHAMQLEVRGGTETFPQDLPLLLYAAFRRTGDEVLALRKLNTLFQRMGVQDVCFSASGSARGTGAFDRLRGTFPNHLPDAIEGPAPLFDGPLITVIMTAYNAERYITTAVRSVLDQSYSNIELLVVDDASTDSTLDVLRHLEASDPRMRVIPRTVNSGTYVAKNAALLQARGTLVAFQDSDDWSHPDRLAKVAAVFQAHPNCIGVTTDWVRMTTDGEIVIKAGGQISHICCISLVFRRAPVVDAIGFFDSVRIEADMEFIRRMGLHFGITSVRRLRWPLLFGRAHSASLTASEEFGLTRTGYTAPRLEYQLAQRAWHETIRRGSDPFMPFPLKTRRFSAPKVMLPHRERTEDA